MTRGEGYMFVFLLIILVFAGMHFFTGWRAVKALNLTGPSRWLVAVLMVLLFFSYPAARKLYPHLPPLMAKGLLLASFIWMAAVFYLFLSLLLLSPVKGRAQFFAAVLITASLLVYGFYEAHSLRVRQLKFRLPGEFKPLRLVFLSDLHISVLPTTGYLRSIVRRVNSFKPDLILIGGDIIEREALNRQDAKKALSQLRAPLGVFAVTGNHEFYTGVCRAVRWIEGAGIRMLHNEVVEVEPGLQLAGVEDRAAAGSEEELLRFTLSKADPSKTLILLKHRPTSLQEAAALGTDLLLAGHTHRGQLFPFHIITSLVYTIHYGRGRVKNMLVYVTSGAYSWGPPVRVAAPPEIVVIDIEPGSSFNPR